MALLTTARGSAALTLGAGASYLVIALWDVSNQSFGSYKQPVTPTQHIPAWLFDTFGHGGPRALLMTMGVLFVAASFWLASRAREEVEVGQRSGTRRLAVLSWALLLLILSLLAFIVAGPLLGNPAIDGVLSGWRERYYGPATALTVIFVLGYWLRLDWKAFRETGDPLTPAVMLPAFAILLGLFFLCRAIFGIA